MRRVLLVAGCAAATTLPDIKHFLVLYFENQSFDRIFGCAGLPGARGVDNTTAFGNYIDPNDESKGFVKATCGAATYVCTHDEDHSFPGVTCADRAALLFKRTTPASQRRKNYIENGLSLSESRPRRTQIFGPGKTDGAGAPYPPATMGGFANVSVDALDLFAPEQLPVKIALAKEFAVFDNLYASIPGPSQPNHMFSQSATSCGCTETGMSFLQCGGKLPLFPQRRASASEIGSRHRRGHRVRRDAGDAGVGGSVVDADGFAATLRPATFVVRGRGQRGAGTIYEALLEQGEEFSIFVNGTIAEGGIPGDLYMSGLLKNVLGRAHTFDDGDKGFYARAARGDLPAFSWLLPRNGGAHPNDDHPCHDMALGEQLLKDVYEALRAAPAWNQTALLVVYDDHGGWYDHVAPPKYAPKPDAACEAKNEGCPNKFAFDRLGARLANVLISPWVRRPRGLLSRRRFCSRRGRGGTAPRRWRRARSSPRTPNSRRPRANTSSRRFPRQSKNSSVCRHF